MRWFVEVASSGQQETEQWVVEAEQWQPALQAARALRGDSSQMNGFSIELLEDGYRAIDPSTLLRYRIRRAPDRTPVTRPGTLPAPAAAAPGGAPRTSIAPAARGGASVPPGQAAPGSQAERIAAMLDVHGTAPPRPARGAGSGGLAKSTSGPPPVAPSIAPAPPLAALTARALASAPSRPPTEASGAAPGALPVANSSSTGAPSGSGRPMPGPNSAMPGAIAARPDAADTRASQVPVAAADTRASQVPGAGAPVLWPPLPPAELLFERAENPTPSSPLTYRESAWVVPAGTSIDAAVRLLMGTFEGVRAALAGVRPGKLVNMAVFDHRFDGKPLRPPLASLTWKDWRDQGQGPDIRRLGEPPHSMRPSFPPPSASAAPQPQPTTIVMPSIPGPPPVPTSVGVAGLRPRLDAEPTVPSGPVAPPRPAPARTPLAAIQAPPSGAIAPSVRPPPAGDEPTPEVGAADAARIAATAVAGAEDLRREPEALRAPDGPGSAAPEPAPVVPQPREATENSAPPAAEGPMRSELPARDAPPSEAAGPSFPEPAVAPQSSGALDAPSLATSAAPSADRAPPAAGALATSDSPSAAPAPVASSRTPPPHSGPRDPISGPQRAPTPRPSSRPSIPGKRLSGDELIADLFEVMHDLHFLRHPLEGADFVLAMIMDKIPSTVGLVHFYDIDAREFVVVRAVGPGSSKVLQIRTSEKEPLIAEAMRKRRAIVLRDGDVARAKNGRWALLEVDTKSVISAPVAQGGRFLGLLEIANPRDGGLFADGDGHALTYIGEQFSEFLGSRGTMMESDRRPSRPH